MCQRRAGILKREKQLTIATERPPTDTSRIAPIPCTTAETVSMYMWSAANKVQLSSYFIHGASNYFLCMCLFVQIHFGLREGV
jgi:hypothetical protein